MASYDLYNSVEVKKALAIGAISSNTTTYSDWIDLSGTYGVFFDILSGSITDGTYVPVIQESDLDDHSDAANVDPNFLLGTYDYATFVAADDNVAKKLGYVGKKRYVRIGYVSSGVTTGGTLSASAVLGIPRHAPTDPGVR